MSFADDLRREEEERRENQANQAKLRGTSEDLEELIEEFIKLCDSKPLKKEDFGSYGEGWVIFLSTEEYDSSVRDWVVDIIGVSTRGELFKLRYDSPSKKYKVENEVDLFDAIKKYSGVSFIKDAMAFRLSRLD
jgi:hypothetical protein